MEEKGEKRKKRLKHTIKSVGLAICECLFVVAKLELLTLMVIELGLLVFLVTELVFLALVVVELRLLVCALGGRARVTCTCGV
nr:hypothetical protein Itr_chr11CG04720 [Ipomoea trifida]